MSKTDEEIARNIMYNDDKKSSTVKPPKELKVRFAPKSVIVESAGVRYQVPSMSEFIRLTKDYEKTRNDLRQSKIDIKVLTETIKKLDVSLRVVEQELANKADKYDSD